MVLSSLKLGLSNTAIIQNTSEKPSPSPCTVDTISFPSSWNFSYVMDQLRKKGEECRKPVETKNNPRPATDKETGTPVCIYNPMELKFASHLKEFGSRFIPRTFRKECSPATILISACKNWEKKPGGPCFVQTAELQICGLINEWYFKPLTLWLKRQ